jgi:hypothetical protein
MESPDKKIATVKLDKTATNRDFVFGKPKKTATKPPPAKAPVSGAFKARVPKASVFRKYYDRGDLPISIEHRGTTNATTWKVPCEKLDYHHYLPIFVDGIRERDDPYKFLAREGTKDLLAAGGYKKILPVIPQLILPLKRTPFYTFTNHLDALNTRDDDTVCVTLLIIQQLVKSGDMIGEAIVPYYRQLLPVFNLFRNKNST